MAKTDVTPHHQGTSVTPEEAKALWEKLKEPTDKKVARAFLEQGRVVSSGTIGRWRRAGWTRDEMYVAETGQQKVLETLERHAGVLDATLELEDGTEVNLNKMSDEALIKGTSRQALIRCWEILSEVGRQKVDLVRDKPRELGNLMEAVGKTIASANAGYDQVIMLRERAMKLVPSETSPPEMKAPVRADDPLADSISAFRTRTVRPQ